MNDDDLTYEQADSLFGELLNDDNPIARTMKTNAAVQDNTAVDEPSVEWSLYEDFAKPIATYAPFVSLDTKAATKQLPKLAKPMTTPQSMKYLARNVIGGQWTAPLFVGDIAAGVLDVPSPSEYIDRLWFKPLEKFGDAVDKEVRRQYRLDEVGREKPKPQLYIERSIPEL